MRRRIKLSNSVNKKAVNVMLSRTSTSGRSAIGRQKINHFEPRFPALYLVAVLSFGISIALGQDNSKTTTVDNSSTPQHSVVGVFLEPMLLGSSENFSMKSSQLPLIASNTSGTSTGYGLGIRLGAHLSEFFLGVDGRYDREQMTDSFYQAATADVYSYGPTAGVQMPYAGLRLMGTYVMGGQFNASPGVSGLQLNFQKPTGWRVGLGFHLGSVSLNLEYQDLTYGTTQVASLGSLAINSNVNMQTETNGYLLSLSFPTEL
jgi:hypothetical protein